MSKLLLATNNQGKVREFRELLEGLAFEVVTPAQLNIRLEVAETGSTFAENARLKAVAFEKASGLLTLADDSGLEVEALGGEPGVYSSRYAGPQVTDAERVKYLLEKLRDIPPEKRTARFRCVIAIASPDGRVNLSSGECQGVISLEPRGRLGFGYDPIFYFPDLQKTMAELPAQLKNQISHRARAARAAYRILKQLEAAQLP